MTELNYPGQRPTECRGWSMNPQVVTVGTDSLVSTADIEGAETPNLENPSAAGTVYESPARKCRVSD